MKINIKSLILIFLVALLGSGIGTFGVLELRGDIKISDKEPIEAPISQVTYTDLEHSDYTKAIDKAYNSVVEISANIQSESYFFGVTNSTAKGSGVIISADGYIITNNHVAGNANGIKVKLYNGEEYDAVLIGADSRSDIAVIKIEKNDLPFSIFADSDQLQMGQETIVIGNPLGDGISCSNGIISALSKEVSVNNVYMDLIQTNAAVNEGNSGGGLFNIEGDLIGIVNCKSTASQFDSASIEGMGYAIPANQAAKIAKDLITYGYVKDRATIGIKVYISSFYSGVLISEVIEGSNAEKAGLKPQDIIVAIDDDQVSSYADLSRILDRHEIGDKVTLRIQRDNSTKEFKIVLQEAIN